MQKELKYTHKTSYRTNSHIKSIINNAYREVSKKTGIRVSEGALSRAFWKAIESDPDLRRYCLETISRMIKEESARKKKDIAKWSKRSR